LVPRVLRLEKSRNTAQKERKGENRGNSNASTSKTNSEKIENPTVSQQKTTMLHHNAIACFLIAVVASAIVGCVAANAGKQAGAGTDATTKKVRVCL
jgi:hypothetical protein